MRLICLAFLLGVILLHQHTSLPSSLWTLLLIPLLFLAKYKKIRLFSAFVCGYLLTLLNVSVFMSQPLSSELEGQDIMIVGVVDSVVVPELRRSHFNFLVKSAELNNREVTLPKRIKLSWYQNAPNLKLGDKWRLTVRLKKPRGFQNPGGFDYQQWLFSQQIGAQGYVRSKSNNHKLVGTESTVSTVSLNNFRQSLADEILSHEDVLKHEAIISALTIGDRQSMTDKQWRVLLVTGTNHLMAISGLHIGLIAGLFFIIGRWLWSRSVYLMNFAPAQQAAAVFAITGAIYYSFLAGFSIPTQRAMIMVIVVMLGYLQLIHRPPSVTLAIALLVVVLWDPLAVLSASFWLSFSAVAILIYGLVGRLGVTGWWWKWGRAQWLLSIGLLPLLLFGFQQASIVSPLANIIAVPWVGFIVVPLSLLSASLAALGFDYADYFFQLTDYSFEIIWLFLSSLADLSWAQLHHPEHPLWVTLTAVFGVMLLLAPRGLPVRILGIVWLLPLILYQVEKPKQGELLFTLLDVGQGLSAVVQTKNHTLVYDAGPKFSDNFDAGRAAVAPYLTKHLGVNRIDRLVIGHGDNDHIGGAASLIGLLDVGEVITSVPKDLLAFNPTQCVAGQKWTWDGVEFEILHPDTRFLGGENDMSCVLRIASKMASILISGDIEKKAERYLIAQHADNLKADIIVVPHHGSLTSSTVAFIDAVSPQVALFAVGYRNKFGFPKDEVLQRYQSRNIVSYDTASQGAISFKINGENHQFNPKTFRHSGRYYYHGKE